MSLETLAQMKLVASSPFNELIQNWKKQGKKVIGWICIYVPEEIIYAADMLPIRVTGDSADIVEADAYLYTNTCSFARSCFEMGIQNQYHFLDGLVMGNTCDPMRRLYDVWRHYIPTPFTHILSIPHKITENAQNFYRKELSHLKERLEEFEGIEILDRSLGHAIEVYNKTRTLLKKLYDLRRGRPLISGIEILEIMKAAMRMPRDQFNQFMEKLLEEVSKKDPLPIGRARLLITGSFLENLEFIKTLEELGGMVVADDLCMGSRYFWDLVDTTLDPLEGLTRRYLNLPCARMRPLEMRIQRLMYMVKEFNVDGVIFESIKFCDIYGHEKPLIKHKLEREGIPVLDLDIEHGGSALGQIRTRVQAFIELLERKKL